MKQFFILSILAIALGFTACDDDNNDFQFDPDLMHYDGVNANAPVLPAGYVEAAAEFGQDAMNFYSGKSIDAVSFFIYDATVATRLVIYKRGNGNSPGDVIYEEDITGELNQNDWVTIPVDPPIPVEDDGMWIAIRFPDGSNLQVIGCDAGPAKEGGDWWYESSIGDWRTFRQVSGDNINWNIRASMTD